MELNYTNLEKNICDTIKEGQIKLGFEKETIRLYYPLPSLQSILGLEKANSNNDNSKRGIIGDNLSEEIKEMTQYLESFKTSIKDRLGNVSVFNNGPRFSFTIPLDGVIYVHESYKANQTFLEFVHLIKEHGVSLDQILTLFRKFSPGLVCLESSNDDFDYIVYFEDSKIDPYLYCLKFHDFGQGHVSYHRYIKSDFDELMEA